MKMKAKSRTLGERIGYRLGRLTRASLAFVVCSVVLALLWQGWFPDLRAPGADLRRVATAALLTGLLAIKIAARVRTAERRRTPRREALSDAELGLLLLTTVYLLLAFSGGAVGPKQSTASNPIAVTASGSPTTRRWKVTRKLTTA